MNFEVKYIGLSTAQVLWNQWYQSALIVDNLEEKFASKRWVTCHQIDLTQEPAFTYCGIDMFGPFLVRDGCKQRKYYGAMFTCMSSRALHIETTNSMSTDSFILALRRLINWRGNVRMIHTDHGANFVGADIELGKAFNEMNHTKINNFLMELGGEWITWHWNSPMASNMGGVQEHQICSARNILNLLLRTNEESINDESLRTWLVEAEGILNSRPITCESIGDVNSYLRWFQCSCWLWRLRWWCHHQEFFRRKIYIAENNVCMFGICVISFDQDGEKKFMQHCKLNWSGSRCKETFKLETLFWYVAKLFEIHGQWHEHWKPLVTRKIWSQCLVDDWKKLFK